MAGNIHTRVNPGWYGWLGDFHEVRGYYPPGCDREYFRRHNINWFMLGHQWVVPFLESDTCNVKQAILENKKRARIWYETYWWGDHSAWGDRDNPKGFAIGHIPPFVLTRLNEKGIKPGGDNIIGKDWLAMASDPAVMASVKKTIQWQLDTIIKHCGRDALYGVILSEEEPDHGVHSVLGQKGGAYYSSHRAEVLPALIKVHNELYDFIKTRYPWLKVSPGFYPNWVEPGTLKMDAVVMDLYPPPGKEEQYIESWGNAYPFDLEQYIILWGYGDRDRKMECQRFERISRGLLARGVKNLGVFRAELALQDKIHRFFDVHGAGDYEPYNLERHRSNVEELLKETTGIVRQLRSIEETGLPQLPEVHPESTETRSGLLRITDQVYAFREQALENAYALVQEMKELHQTREISALLMAEHLATAASAASPQLTATQLSSWEKLSKEYGSLPVFYEKVIPVRKQRVKAVEALRRRMTVNPEDLSERLPRELADEVSTILQQTSRRLEQLRISEARALVNAAYEKLRKAGQERSLRLRIVVANKYRKPLNVKLTLTAHWPGTKTELYSDYPCTTDDATSEIIAHLPTKPAAIVLTTTPWTGSLPVRVWELSNSRDAFRPGKATESSHVAGLEEWLEDNQTGFTISPWSGRAHVRFIY